MDFFDKLGKKASEAYKVTADKTGKLAKEAKLRMKISELKSQINDMIHLSVILILRYSICLFIFSNLLLFSFY